MSTIHNEITIHAPADKIWSILATPDLLDKYNPTIKSSILVSVEKTGHRDKRKINMHDGKNWFEEKITEYAPSKVLNYQLTDCSFPIKGLKHTYHFEKSGGNVKLMQTMNYEVKFGLFGKLMDRFM